MIVFTEEKKFSREDVQELFLSVGWISGQYPGRLFKALMNSSTVVTAWDGDRLAGLVRVLDDAPWVSRIAGRHHVEIGGFALSEDGRRLVVVATEDNLLKGAATQALQNLNMAFGFDELMGNAQG